MKDEIILFSNKLQCQPICKNFQHFKGADVNYHFSDLTN